MRHPSTALAKKYRNLKRVGYMLRQKIIQARQGLTADAVASASKRIATQLLSLPCWQSANTISIYHSIHHEVDPSLIAKQAWQENKRCYLPICRDEQPLIFLEYTPDTIFAKKNYGIMEPVYDADLIIPAESLDLVITPLIAFDQTGTRLGWGKGFYDRTFAFLLNTVRPSKPLLIGVAYQFQYCEHLERRAWDVPVDRVITEEQIYSF